MALRQLMLAKQIAGKEKELEEMRGKDADFETREKNWKHPSKKRIRKKSAWLWMTRLQSSQKKRSSRRKKK